MRKMYFLDSMNTIIDDDAVDNQDFLPQNGKSDSEDNAGN